MLGVRLGDVAAAELDQHAVANVARGRVERRRIVDAEFFTVVVDLDAGALGLELRPQMLGEVGCCHAMRVFADKSLQRFAELFDLRLGRLGIERINVKPNPR